MKLRSIRIVEDRTRQGRPDQGFLRVARLTLRNRYEDGSESEPYACDVVSRPGSDAVVAVLYEVGEREVRVLLREGPRAPIYLRRFKQFEHPDPHEYLTLLELVAGIVEAGDGAGPDGLRRRAAVEAEAEAGVRLRPGQLSELGGETFASPGTSDEKLFYCAAPVCIADRGEPSGDGSVMEEAAEIVALELGAAIEACRRGEIPDMKTEVGLLRLADHLGYVAQLGCFVDELPPELRARYRSLGIRGPDAPTRREPA
ncbi:MAG: NUDIX hydrolase [Gaiellales bacterium]